MVFAVYIVCDGTTDGDEFGTGSDWQKPAAWHEDVEYLCQGYACFAAQETCFLVEGDEALQVCQV